MKAHVPGVSRPLTTGDIVSFQFPYFDGPGDKDRPCLVIHVDEAAGEAVLAYGTSIFSDEPEAFSLTVKNASNLAAVNLVKPTRFLCKRRVRVKASDPRFAVNSEGTSVIGQLLSDIIDLDLIYASLPLRSPDKERLGVHPKKAKLAVRRSPPFGLRRPRTAIVA